MNLLALWIALGVLFVSLVALAVVSRRNKTWYSVYMANPEMSIEHVYRTIWDKMWLTGEGGIMLFHKQNGQAVRLSKHWIIKIEEE